MGKIKGKFAPLTEELGNDPRFILECTDFEKLIYMLIIYTTHMTRHAAPVDPAYYQSRYGLKTRRVRIAAAISTLLTRFPNLKCTDGKLSLINSATYKSQILPKESIEVEKEEELEVEEEREKEEALSFSKEKETQKTESPFNRDDAFQALWQQYPVQGRFGVADSREAFSRAIETKEFFDKVLLALGKYIGHLEKHSWKHPMNFLNWFEQWREWENYVEPSPPKRTQQPDEKCTACKGSGTLPDGKKCWCWTYRAEKITVKQPEECST